MAVGTREGEKSLPPPLTIGLLALSCEHDVPLPYIQLSGRFPLLAGTVPDGGFETRFVLARVGRYGVTS